MGNLQANPAVTGGVEFPTRSRGYSMAVAGLLAVTPCIGAAQGGAPRLVNRDVSAVAEAGRSVLRFAEGPQPGLYWFPAIPLNEGVIEFDARGRDVQQRSFFGVAFRALDDSTYDAVYLRPFNFRATDSTRRAHAVQYMSMPRFDWPLLRSERPGVFEAPIEPVPDPAAWVHVRVEVSGREVLVFVDGAVKPALRAHELSERSGGGIGLWVGVCSDGDFANFRVTPRGGSTRTIPLSGNATRVSAAVTADAACRGLKPS